MPAADLRRRLQRLRAHKLAREVSASSIETPASAASDAGAHPLALPARVVPPPVSDRLPGRPIETPRGSYQLIENSYALDFQHGPKRLADLLGHETATAARLAGDPAFAETDLRSLAFIDTETTGLAGGAGTLVFLIGVGACEGDQFVLRQYFMTEPSHEAVLLKDLIDDLAPRSGWVTFNGRAFDLPLLEGRLTLNRQRGALGQRPHLDLLMPARRLYRGRLSSCSLSHIEQHVLHILREDDDVPGALIPQMYADYLHTHDPREMRRVIYHNTVDILSMVTLAAHLLDVFGGEPRHSAEPRGGAARSPEDWLRLALWHDDNGRLEEAEPAYRRALAGRLKLDDRAWGLRRFAQMLKRQARRAEAVPLWEQMASFTLDDPEAFVELAKYCEWEAGDLAKAQAWSERAVALVNGWPRGWQRQAALDDLQHRLERLQKKSLARGG